MGAFPFYPFTKALLHLSYDHGGRKLLLVIGIKLETKEKRIKRRQENNRDQSTQYKLTNTRNMPRVKFEFKNMVLLRFLHFYGVEK